MLWFITLLTTLISFSSLMSSTVDIEHTYQQANEAYQAALYERAELLYRQTLEKLEETPGHASLHEEVELLLARCLILNGRFNGAITFLEEEASVAGSEKSYLLGLANKKSNTAGKAIVFYNRYLSSCDDKEPLRYKEEAIFELGHTYYEMQENELAGACFERLAKTGKQTTGKQTRLGSLSQLYLARLDFIGKRYEKAAEELSLLNAQLREDPLLQFECSYLQGVAYFQLQQYDRAAVFFERALPNRSKPLWYYDTLYHLGWCYLKSGEEQHVPASQQADLFQKSEKIFLTLLEQNPEERVYLALGQSYISQASRLKDEEAYKKAEALLSKQEAFTSKEGQAQALLLRAEAASSYIKRDSLYRHLTQEGNKDNTFYLKGWYLRGLNDLGEGRTMMLNKKNSDARPLLEQAISSLGHTAKLSLSTEPPAIDIAALSWKYQIEAYELLATVEGDQQALKAIETVLAYQPNVISALEEPGDIYYLKARIAMHLAKETKEQEPLSAAEEALIEAIRKYPTGDVVDKWKSLLGTLYYQKGDFAKALEVYINIFSNYPASSFAGDSYFWAASSLELLKGDDATVKEYRRTVFEKYPNNAFSAEAYFLFYPYQDYVQGDRTAMKHLQAMSKKFPNSPFLLNAYYLIGLDFKRDRKTPEGRWIRKRSLTDAIDAFQEVETAFDFLYQKGLIPQDQLDMLTSIRYRATLERALSNLAIADESQGAKKQIYLEYAREVFQYIITEINNINRPQQHRLIASENNQKILEEATYGLAQTYIKAGDDDAAESIFVDMIEKYQQLKITRGYFLSRVWYDRSQIAMRRQDFLLALNDLQNAEDAAKGKALSTDQRLDLWIQQSLCYRTLNQLEQTILILSKVVNDPAVSSLRLKAMYLRAQAYALQGRHELARKQLEATAKKGGTWALQAKATLEKDYAYH